MKPKFGYHFLVDLHVLFMFLTPAKYVNQQRIGHFELIKKIRHLSHIRIYFSCIRLE